MDNTFDQLIFTNHAIERLRKRNITQYDLNQVFKYPEHKIRNGKDHGKTKFIKTVSGRRMHLIAQPVQDNKWLVISAWVKGEEDKSDLSWLIISAPFRLIGWLFKIIWRKIFTQKPTHR